MVTRRGFENYDPVPEKTLSEQHPDSNYAATRAFYSSVGFEPLEEIPELWGSETPCLYMIREVPPQEGRIDV